MFVDENLGWDALDDLAGRKRKGPLSKKSRRKKLLGRLRRGRRKKRSDGTVVDEVLNEEGKVVAEVPAGASVSTEAEAAPPAVPAAKDPAPAPVRRPAPSGAYSPAGPAVPPPEEEKEAVEPIPEVIPTGARPMDRPLPAPVPSRSPVEEEEKEAVEPTPEVIPTGAKAMARPLPGPSQPTAEETASEEGKPGSPEDETPSRNVTSSPPAHDAGPIRMAPTKTGVDMTMLLLIGGGIVVIGGLIYYMRRKNVSSLADLFGAAD